MSFSRVFVKNIQKGIVSCSRQYSKDVHPFTRTWGMINEEIRSGFNQKPVYPEHADVVIIGGGYIGSSVAYWLKTRAGEGLSVVVIEKDTQYAMCEKLISHGIISQHFSLPENIYLSQQGSDFLRNIRDHVKNDIDIQFHPHGSLILASEKYAEKLEQNVELQKEYGIKNKLVTPEEIHKIYPWINTSDIKLGCISKETEGFVNPQRLLQGLVQRSQQLGANYLNSEVIGFNMERQHDVLMEGVKPGSFQKINSLIYRTNDNEEISLKFAICVIAAGTESAQVAKLANIGQGSGLLTLPLPVEKREYDVYSIEDAIPMMSVGLNAPFIMDTSGLWLRRNGLQNNFICGQIPSLTQETDIRDNAVFQTSLNNRFPDCKNSEVKTISKEYFDCNTYDDTGILGPHPYHTNLIFATGFGRHGIHHAPGIGKAVAEVIIDCQYTTIDLLRLGFDRILMDEPLIEFNVY